MTPRSDAPTPLIELFAVPRTLATNPHLPPSIVALCANPPDTAFTLHRLLRLASSAMLDEIAESAASLESSPDVRGALASFCMWLGQNEGLTFFPDTNMAPFVSKLVTMVQAERLARMGYMRVDYPKVTLQPGPGPSALLVTQTGAKRLQSRQGKP